PVESPPLEPVLSCRALTKRYGELLAVDGITFSLERGTVTGFLGPNGAGKTTTLRLLLGLAEPTAGEAPRFRRRDRGLRPPARPGRSGTRIERLPPQPQRSRPPAYARARSRAPACAGRRSARAGRAGRQSQAAGEDLLARHAPAAWPRRGAARRPRAPDPRRA